MTVAVGTVGAEQGLLGIEAAEPELAAAIRAELVGVEEALRAAVADADPFVTRTARHLADAGGKRIRPLLTLLAAHFGHSSAPEVTAAALVVELTHLATLYHDDVMDEAVVRRGAPSANTRWTNSVAILTGDYLFARASDIVSDLGPDAVRIQARTFSRLVRGQIRETVGPGEHDEPLAHYLDVIAEKTGALFATAARFGALFAGCPPDVVQALTAYSEVIGIAFQLSDDLLDVASSSAELGKTPGTDLREGVPTLPVLHALASTDPGEERLRSLVSRPLVDEDEVAEALALLRDSPAMDSARATLASYASQAGALLVDLPDVPVRRALEALTRFVVDRTS